MSLPEKTTSGIIESCACAPSRVARSQPVMLGICKSADDHIRRPGGSCPERIMSTSERDGGKSGSSERLDENVPDIGVVINDEYAVCHASMTLMR